MTVVYFVRHAQPDENCKDDRNRPLTEIGMQDSKEVTRVLKDRNIDYLISSPYRRCIDTINDLADILHMKIDTDERLRERKSGVDGNNRIMFEKRWSDFNYHEKDGECLADGTALSTILNYYDKNYNVDGFLKIIDYLPYIIRLDFDKVHKCVSKIEELIVQKEYK